MKDIEELQDYEKVRGKLRLPAEVKPCLMNMLNGSSPGLIGQGRNAFIVSCELCRVGRSNKQIESILTKQNIRPSKIQGILKSVTKDMYSYGCPRLEELDICIYESRFECPWFEKIPRESQKEWRERDFWRYGWAHRLSAPQVVIYLALKEVEKIRRYRAGSRLYVSWDELQGVSGVNRQTIKPGLEALEKLGLIRYKPGQKRVKGLRGVATEIWRIIPIPKP